MLTECEQCSGKFLKRTADQRFCSAKCRKAAFVHRQQSAGTVTERVESPSGRPKSTFDAVLAELTTAERADSYLGRAALALAQRIDASTAVMGFAALVKELRSTMDAALVGVARVADPLDELRTRRDRKYANG